MSSAIPGVSTDLPAPISPDKGYTPNDYQDPDYWVNSFKNSSLFMNNVEQMYQSVSGSANRHTLMAKAKAVMDARYAQADADIAAIEAGDPAGAQKFMKNWHITEEIEKAFSEFEQGSHSIAADAISKSSRS